MAQLIYSILALLLIMFLSMNMQRSIGKDQESQALNEVTTQLTGAGTEVLEQIGATYFDRYHPTNLGNEPYCGLLHDYETNLLTAEVDFPTYQCADFATCAYIEGFLDLSTTIKRGDFEFEVNVTDIEYVDPVTYATSANQTFAKRVTVNVDNPYLYIGDDPNDPESQLDLSMSRVFTYSCATEDHYMPYKREPGDPCNPAAPHPCLIGRP